MRPKENTQIQSGDAPGQGRGKGYDKKLLLSVLVLAITAITAFRLGMNSAVPAPTPEATRQAATIGAASTITPVPTTPTATPSPQPQPTATVQKLPTATPAPEELSITCHKTGQPVLYPNSDQGRLLMVTVITESIMTRPADQKFRLIVREGRRDESRGNCTGTILGKIEYPVLSTAKPSEREALDTYARAYLNEAEEHMSMLWGRAGGTLESGDIDYSITVGRVISTPVYVGVVVVTYNSFGGAHPFESHSSINFDRRLAQPAALADLFKPGSEYHRFLADVTYNDLTARHLVLDPSFVVFAKPEPEYFEHRWLLAPEGLVLMFDDWSLATFRTGYQLVTIPYEKLRPYMRPGSLIEAVANRAAGR